MQLTIFGVGYVGLVSGACFAKLGHHVVCYDIDDKKIAKLKKGELPIVEPGLRELIETAVAASRLRFTHNLIDATRSAEVLMIAVGTPPLPDGNVDMRYVHAVAETIGETLQENSRVVVVTKSTVPVGTTNVVSSIIAKGLEKRGVTRTFSVVSNPEFLGEGSAVRDFLEPDRIVIGYTEPWARQRMEELYESFLAKNVPVFWTDPASAEMAKYGANAMLASRISFMNEMARLCETTGANIEMVRDVMASDKRIGKHFLQPGIGYGGSCFSKDIRALVAQGKDNNVSLSLLQAVESVNDEQKNYFVQKIHGAFHGNVRGKVFAVWGLAYKPKTNDMRFAPSITVIQRLVEKGATVQAYDPEAMDEARAIFQETIQCADSAEACLTGADALIILTDWDEFRNPNWELVRSRLRKPHVFDGRNMFVPESVAEHGLFYWSVGRPVPSPAPRA